MYRYLQFKCDLIVFLMKTETAPMQIQNMCSCVITSLRGPGNRVFFFSSSVLFDRAAMISLLPATVPNDY